MEREMVVWNEMANEISTPSISLQVSVVLDNLSSRLTYRFLAMIVRSDS